jgi:hypothetical protein
MDKRRLIFFAIFGGFHVATFIFTLVVESSAQFLLSLVSYVEWFKYFAFLGVVMVATEFVWSWQDSKKSKKKEDDMRLENNTLKAKVYDMQESGKPRPEVVKPTAK